MKKILVFILSLSCSPVFAQNTIADKNYHQAEIYFKNGLYDKAWKSIDDYVIDDGDIPKADEFRKKIKECQDIYSKAESFYFARKYSEALSQYEKLQKLNPTHPELNNKIASCRNAIDSKEGGKSAKYVYTNDSICTSARYSNSQSNSKHVSALPLKPESFTMEFGIIGGTNLGASIDFTISYFLIGVGIDWIMIIPEKTKTTNLVNSGYVGNFTKITTLNLSGTCTNLFLDLGGYFKYFSVSCQIGLLCGTMVERTLLYNGSGYGLVDGDLNEYWGSYSQRSFANTSSDKELHLTLTPQVKGYIPVGRQKEHSISLGLGYTFVSTLGYSAGLSGNLGIHFRF